MRPLMQGAMQKHAETAAAANLAFCAEPEEPPAKPPAAAGAAAATAAAAAARAAARCSRQ